MNASGFRRAAHAQLTSSRSLDVPPPPDTIPSAPPILDYVEPPSSATSLRAPLGMHPSWQTALRTLSDRGPRQ